MNYKKIEISTSGLATIVSAVDGCKIRVISYMLCTDAANSFIWKSGETAISGSLAVSSILQDGQAGAPAPNGMLGVLQTNSGEALNLQVANATVVGGYLTYVTAAA